MVEYKYDPLETHNYPQIEQLLEIGKNILKGMDYKENEIIPEYNHPKTNTRIDIAGIRENYNTAIELGKCSYKKLFALEEYFEKVIWLPYWFQKITTSNDSPEHLRLEKQIKELQKEYNEIKTNLEREAYLKKLIINTIFQNYRSEIDEYLFKNQQKIINDFYSRNTKPI